MTEERVEPTIRRRMGGRRRLQGGSSTSAATPAAAPAVPESPEPPIPTATLPPSRPASVAARLERWHAAPEQWQRSVTRRFLEGPGWTRSRLLVDGLALMLAIVLTTEFVAPSQGRPLSVWTYPVFSLVMLTVRGLYRDDARMARLDAIAKITGALSLAAMLVIVLGAVAEPDARPTLFVGPAWVASVALVTGSHLTFERLRRAARERGMAGKTTLIVGAGLVGGRIERRLLDHPEIGLKPIGFVDSPDAGDKFEGRVLGDPRRLRAVIQETGAEHVIFAFLPIPDSELLPLVRDCETLGVGISVVPRLFETTSSHVELSHIGGLPLFAFRRIDPQGWQFALKHVFDRLGAALLILILSPLLLLIAVAVKLSSPGPILFRQARSGRDGAEFDIFKFRTMHLPKGPSHPDSDWPPEDVAPGGVEGQDRRTRLGAVLRRASLDELPQLFNVLRGDMSIVGPRPPIPKEVAQYEAWQCRRLSVRPGLTCIWQVSGRNQISFEEWMYLDMQYIDHWSLAQDFNLILRTVPVVLTGRGAS